MGNLATVFLTGLLTGGLTCMAVQGGLLAATLATAEEERLEEKAKGGNALPILAFLISKLIAYTILGALLGFLGSFFQLSIPLRVMLQIAVAIFMIGTAANILEIHPIFRYFAIQPPKFLTRFVRNQSKSKSIFAPALLGAFTIFIPCGTTQAMMALSVATGKPLLGAGIMFAFILGTSPVFFILGYFATKLGDLFHESFMRLAAFALILLAIFNINNAISLTGSNLTLENIIGSSTKAVWCTFAICSASGVVPSAQATTDPTIIIGAVGYNPNAITVPAGKKITIHLQNQGGTSCIQAFTIPSLGIQKIVPPGASDMITFTAPNETRQIAFMCSMGMYRGVINVKG